MKYLILLFLVGLALSSRFLNQKYYRVLHGQTPLTDEITNSIYSEFTSYFEGKSFYRIKIFHTRLQSIIDHNKKNLSWKKGINQFSDMTYQEIRSRKLINAPQECSATYNLKVAEKSKNLRLPESYDWNNFGVVTPVKDQGDCGSCWTFSTTGTLQAHWNIKQLGKDMDFSEQQLVDCAVNFNNFGCDGGLPSQAFQYIKFAGGLQTEATYPYYAKDMPCVYNQKRAVGYVKYGSFNITRDDQNQLAERLYNVGPIAVSYDVLDDFIDYQSGVYRSDECGTTTDDVNHATTLTGYGTQNGLKYWRIKNEWGADWGDQGYFKIERGVNMCAIAQCNSYPLIDEDSLKDLQTKSQ